MIQLISITAPHLCAAIEVDLDNGVVIKAAPILHYMKGSNLRWVESYCRKKGWDVYHHPNLYDMLEE